MTPDELRAILDERLQNLEQKLDERLRDALQEKLQPLWQALNAMRARVDRIDERMDRQEKFVFDDLAKTRSAISSLKESIETRDYRLDEHGRRLNRLEQDMDELKSP